MRKATHPNAATGNSPTPVTQRVTRTDAARGVAPIQEPLGAHAAGISALSLPFSRGGLPTGPTSLWLAEPCPASWSYWEALGASGNHSE